MFGTGQHRPGCHSDATRDYCDVIIKASPLTAGKTTAEEKQQDASGNGPYVVAPSYVPYLLVSECVDSGATASVGWSLEQMRTLAAV